MKIVYICVVVIFMLMFSDMVNMIRNIGSHLHNNSVRGVLDSLSTRLKIPVYVDEIPRGEGLYDRRGTKHYVFKYAEVQCFVIIEPGSEETVDELFWRELHLRIPEVTNESTC